MKTIGMTILLLLMSCLSFGQGSKMKVTFTNGRTHTGIYEIQYYTKWGALKKVRVISKDSKKKYKVNEIERVICYSGNDSILIRPIPTLENVDSESANVKLGTLVYKGNNLEVYTVPRLSAGGRPTIWSYENSYARKKGEDYYYNIGWIDGAGPRGLKRRIREFFNDCPKLIEKVESKEIPKKETMQIVKFYEEHCGI